MEARAKRVSQPSWSVRVRVPASTANLGPGFDVAGMALGLYNEFEVEIVPKEKGSAPLQVAVSGEGRGRIPLGENNLMVRACRKTWREAGWHPHGHLRVHLHNRIPTGSGLGSSASAIVGGLVAANHLMGNRLGVRRLLELATEMEGHPDNVAAAMLGGVTFAVAGEGRLLDWVALPAPEIKMVVGIPDFQLPTRIARKALPPQVSFEDAVFNVGRASLLAAALCRGRLDLLKTAMEDRLHHPYRSRLVPGMEAAFAGAKKAGALGVALSGAGPTVVAFIPPEESGDAVSAAIKDAFAESGVACRLAVLEPDHEGAQVVSARVPEPDEAMAAGVTGDDNAKRC